MKWSELFTSSVGKKFVMALTGIFLVSFLVVHVGINACIWAMDGGEMFNQAAHFMGATVVIRIIEVGLFAGFFLHIIQGLVLVFQNRKRRAVGYLVSMGNNGSKWYSRSMGLLGTIVLLFLIIHWKQFWIPSRFSDMPEVTLSNGSQVHDLFSLMKDTFTQAWVVILYVLACISLAFHLLHGFQSAFRSLGVYNNRYLHLLGAFGVGFSIIVPLAFAMMPVSFYFNWVQ
jgi:succinate dehydrogenase / fumarate reductase cytochrome b subunit